MTPLLSLNQATFRLGDRLVFENTSWSFRRNEQWGVIGPNGSGKSLFGEALRGRLPVVGGELKYHFRGSAGLTAEECIGHVSFQDRKASLDGAVVQSRWNSLEEDPARTVADFLSYQRVMSINPFEVTQANRQKRSAFVRRLRRASALLGIERFFGRDLLSLSNGETQKVHLARALALPLRLLILDEPLTGLDGDSRAHFQEVLQRLMRTGLRVLVITTRFDDLPQGITNCLGLNDCRIVASVRHKKFLKSTLVRRSRPATKRSGLRSAFRSRGSNTAYRTLGQPLIRGAAPLVQLRNVSVRYDSATVLDGVDWSIYPGESWALLGPNGSGKTTLLSLILGDNPQAYQNEVTVFGKRRGSGESIWELKHQIGWVSPEMHLHFDYSVTCLEAVESGFHDTVGLFNSASPKQKQASLRWLARFGLRGMASAPLFALSSGLQRMVLLARALVKRPKLLVLDEPCQGLDPFHRDVFVQAVDSLIRRGEETAIFVTHRPEEIPPSVHRVLRLRNGRVTES